MKNRLNNKGLWLAGGVVILGVIAGVVVGVWHKKAADSPDSISQKANYETHLPARVVAKVTDGLGKVTRLKLTSDDQTMFVTTLDGKLWVLAVIDGKFVKQPTPLYQMDLGWPDAAENGLTGLILSADFPTNHNLFLTYAKSSNGSTGQNQILRLTVEKQGDSYVASDPKVIFTSNAAAGGAHQIQGGIGLRINEKPHLLFALGENYRPADSLNLSKEAGKIMLIQEDGSNPLGARPYPNNPKIQVIGLRNAYDLTIDPENEDWVYWAENGADSHDRVVYAPILDATKQFSGNWAGDDKALTTLSVNGKQTDEYIAQIWPKTVAPTDIIADKLGRFYLNIFSSANDSTKQILMGEKDRSGRWSLAPIVTRRAEMTGGNLLGLAMSAKGDFYFGDFSDGAIYILTESWNKQAK